MEILTPIGIGFISNAVLFIIIILIGKKRKRNTGITLILAAANSTLFLAVAVFIFSLFVGGWTGMGLGVISFGALLVPVCLYLYTIVITLLGKR